MRRRARVDATHASIVQALRSVGWVVQDACRVGGGFPDLVVARGGQLKLVEVKDGAKAKSRRGLTPAQVIFRDQFAAVGVDVVILTSIDDALALGHPETREEAR